MTNNPYYHEVAFGGLDPQLIRWAIIAAVIAITLVFINTAVKPISWRCRGVRTSRARMRACRKYFALRLADDKTDKIAIVLPSESWEHSLADAWTCIVIWQAIVCHGAGYLQYWRNKAPLLAEAMVFLTILVGAFILSKLMTKVLYYCTLTKVAILAKWYDKNHVEIPPVIQKWGMSDVCNRIALNARKRKEAEARLAATPNPNRETESRKEVC